MNANALSTNAGLADNHVQTPWFQSPCLEAGTGPFRRPVWNVHGDFRCTDGSDAGRSWPGRALGVRRPECDETALSPSEVLVLLQEFGL